MVYSNKNNVQVYPNPATDKINIISDDYIEQITLADLTGKTVFSNRNLNQSITQINVSSLNPGIYILRVTDRKGVISNTKIIIQ